MPTGSPRRDKSVGFAIKLAAISSLLLGTICTFRAVLHTENRHEIATRRIMTEIDPSSIQKHLDGFKDGNDASGFSAAAHEELDYRVASWERIQPIKEEGWDRSCSPTPWLLPKDIDLPYKGLHNDLDALASMQARHIDGYKAVSVLFFNYHQSVMMQNAVYSIVKWGGVCNYIVAVWDEPSLEACQAMNLPCFNATAMTPGQAPIGTDKEARLHSKDYVRITWMKPILVAALLDLGYLVHASDIDISFTPADLTRSYLDYLLKENVTAAFQRENKHPFVVNTGNYMILPNAQGKELMRLWLSRGDAAIASGDHEQTALGELYYEKGRKTFLMCTKPLECRDTVAKSYGRPIIRRFGNSWFLAFGNTCITKEPEKMFPIHPCSLPNLYYHAVCVIGSAAKVKALKSAGMWFLDDGEDSKKCPVDADNPDVVRCRPLAERIPEVEVDFLQCDPARKAFSFYQTLPKGAGIADSSSSSSAAVEPKEDGGDSGKTASARSRRLMWTLE